MAGETKQGTRLVVSAGWERGVTLWQPSGKAGVVQTGLAKMQAATQGAAHRGDILTCARCYSRGPSVPMLATGGDDGALVLWHLDSAYLVAKLQPPKVKTQNDPR